MTQKVFFSLLAIIMFPSLLNAQNNNDSVSVSKFYDLEEVVVTGSRIPISRAELPTPVSVVNRATIEQSEESNLMPVLMKYVPSLFVTSRGIAGYGVSTGAAGGINLRGLSGGAGRVLILIDGHPQYATIFGHPVADAYIASDAERVEVSRGSASILYGSNAMGGAINIITRKALKDGNKLSARLMGGSYGTQMYSVTDSYRKGRFSGVMSGNYDRSDGHRTDMGFESFSGYAKLGYELTKEWKATGNINIAKANTQNPGTISSPLLDNTADVLRGMAGLSIENDYGKTRGAVNFYYNWGDHEINDGYSPGGTPREFLFHSTDYMGGVNIFQAINLFEGNTVTGGFDVKLYGGNAYRNPETEIYADHIDLNEIAGYFLAQQMLGRFLFDAGIRLENHSLYGTEWIPEAGISYKAAAQTHLKLSASKGFRTPNMRELYMYAPANEELLPERSWSYDFTVMQGLLDNRLNMELTFYYMTGDNIVEVVTVDGRPKNQNVGNFTNKGLEFGFDYRILRNLNLNGNYSYLDMETPLTGAPKQKMYAGITYIPGKFTFNAGVQVINELYLATGTNPQTTGYTLLDARAAFKATKWMDIFVKGDNLTARSYETMLGYLMPKATVMAGVNINL